MVKPTLKLICLFLLYAGSLFSEEVKVNAEIDDKAQAGNALKGTITVTHDKTNLINASSFRMDDKPLPVVLIKEVQVSPNDPLVLTLYQFEMPAQPKGLYILSSISVAIGGETYQSPRTTYEVQAASTTPPVPAATSPPVAPTTTTAPPPQQKPASTGPALRLEAYVEGSDRLYPGQRTKLVYRYYYSGDINLTKEVLPLLDAKGLVKIGEKVIKSGAYENFSINEISQEVQAADSGTYSFGPSTVEGQSASGVALSSVAPPVVVTVLPFPQDEKPASFNGAVGKYQFSASLLSDPHTYVGDELSLAIEIRSSLNVKEAPLPDVSKQPGFDGFFNFSDLPPEEEVQVNKKRAVLLLRPLSSEIKEIPAIEFSSFDPRTSQYTIVRSDSIPLVVETTPSPAQQAKQKKKPAPATSTMVQEEATDEASPPKTYDPQPIEIERNKTLQTEDLYDKIFGTWTVFAIVPFGLALLIYISHLREFFDQQKKKTELKSSRELFMQALQLPLGSSQYFDQLQQAVKQAMIEGGHITAVMEEKDYPSSGLMEEAKQFLNDIDTMRYSKGQVVDEKELRQRGEDLISRLRKEKK